MQRRHILAVLGTSLVAGCSSDSDNSGPTRTPSTSAGTTTPSPRETETPEPEPVIEAFSLVSERLNYQEGEEIEGNRLSGVGTNGEPVLAFNTEIPVSNNSADWQYNMTIDSGGEEIESFDPDKFSKIVTDEETHSHKYWIAAGTGGWSRGTHTATLTVLDSSSGKTATSTTEFEVNAPLTASDVELVNVDFPDSVEVGETDTTSITFRNLTDRASSYIAPVSVRVDGGEWHSTEWDFNLPADTTRDYLSQLSPEETGVTQLYLHDFDKTISYTMVE